MKHRLTRIEVVPILASASRRVGWAVIGGFVGGATVLVLMFLAGPDRPAYSPFFEAATPPTATGAR